eukprot:CAMPEP_0197457160 /NCGR_PEP_ID=MMETSP1175-20131217/45285_1 /TAXON_ID=1003142 /ORGANISM="Triceratium dubium, Strain CCMP147" /LENGTH=453 /DNA_ID=CAMNT_0042991433 /DNA_START=9 /DNA_END=1370 /DNA_ORIENTATION=+
MPSHPPAKTSEVGVRESLFEDEFVLGHGNDGSAGVSQVDGASRQAENTENATEKAIDDDSKQRGPSRTSRPIPADKSALKSCRTIGRSKVARQNAKDEEHGKSRSALDLIQFSGMNTYYLLTITALVIWSCICAWGSTVLVERSKRQPGGNLSAWLGWVEAIDVKVIGGLFTFSLVFRFNTCYKRWWQGRMLWGNIIQHSIDLSQMVSLWIIDREFVDRLNRLIIAFPYACKAQLRGLSITDPAESGQELVRKGILTKEVISYLDRNPCWQPKFFLDLMRNVLAKVFLAEYEKGNTLILPHKSVNKELHKPLDISIYDLEKALGDCVSVRSAGLPKSYDVLHHAFFWIYFSLAPPVWSLSIGWLTPVLTGLSASIVMTLINLGTCLVDPFGTDVVDLPLEKFCETVEAQVRAIQLRSRCPDMKHFAEFSSMDPDGSIAETDPMKLSSHLIELR